MKSIRLHCNVRLNNRLIANDERNEEPVKICQTKKIWAWGRNHQGRDTKFKLSFKLLQYSLIFSIILSGISRKYPKGILIMYLMSSTTLKRMLTTSLEFNSRVSVTNLQMLHSLRHTVGVQYRLHLSANFASINLFERKVHKLRHVKLFKLLCIVEMQLVRINFTITSFFLILLPVSLFIKIF